MEPEAMKRFAAALLAVAALAAPASAATLYVGHGIDGRDLGLDQALPVDICLVNGPSAVESLVGPFPYALFTNVPFSPNGTFDQVPLDLPAGEYSVEVQLAPSNDCTGTVAIASSFTLGFGETATAFAHLSEYGTPTLTKFENDVRAMSDGRAKLFARHAAAFGDVNILARQRRSEVFIPGLENAQQEGANVREGSWNVKIFPAGSLRPAFNATLTLASQKAYFAYAVGTPAKGTFTVLIQALDVK
jgi:hypothetical protein